MKFKIKSTEAILNAESDTLNVCIHGDEGRYICFMRSWDDEFHEDGADGLEVEVNSQSGLISGRVIARVCLDRSLVRVELKTPNRLGESSVEAFGEVPGSILKLIELVVEDAVTIVKQV